MTGLDEIYGQEFNGTTNSTGIVMLDNVFFSQYRVSAIKNGYQNLLDTIDVSKINNTFALMLTAINPGFIFDFSESARPFFKIQPNPTTGAFTLELLEKDDIAGIRVEIFDMMGQMLKQVDFSGQSRYDLDIGDHREGIYLVRVTKGDDQGTARLILR
jgi:hypothetical protein